MTLKLSSLKADLDREEAGAWIEYPDWPGVSFCVSAITKGSYVVARDVLMQKLVRQSKGKPMPVSTSSPLIGALYAEHLLHDWRGLDVPYSPEVARETLTDPAYRAVVSAVEWCASQVGAIHAEWIEDAEKNSGAPSAGD